MDDLDMDIDFQMDSELQDIQAQADQIAAEAAGSGPDPQLEPMKDVEDGEVNQMDPVAKIHIRGLEPFKPRDVDNYAAEHFSTDLFKRIQWIDDNHANFVYDTQAAAEEALQAFSAEEVEDGLEFRPAKPLSTHPDVKLEVRQAVVSDVKIPGAKDRSRFYLMNPEFDPDNKSKGRRLGGGPGRARRGGYEGERFSRRSSGDNTPFDENFYDDDPKSVAARQDLMDGIPRRSKDQEGKNGSDRRDRVRSSGTDLFAGKQNGRLRDSRSRSPLRDGNGKYGFSDDQPQRQTARRRSHTPPHLRRDTQTAREQKRRELFPEKKAKELFPNRHASPIQDVHHDQVTDAIREIHLPRVEDAGFEFKGKGRAGDGQNGFSILGASKVKELFPNKGSKGKDLFEGRTAGRSTLRNKAEDLF